MDMETSESLRKADLEKAARDKAEFLEDLEEDPEMWKQVNLYRDDDVSSVTASDVEDEEFPGPQLDDLISGIGKMDLEDMDCE
jgi:hypothetical protein